VADLRRGTKYAWVVPGMIAINAGIFAYQVFVQGMPISGMGLTNEEARLYQQQLMEWGANSAEATLVDGEYWRLVASMFLHGGILHVGMNMFVLGQIGPLVERLLGNLPFLIVYMLAGIFGSLASAWFNGGTSVGASGAVFGVFGALLAYLLMQWRTMPRAALLSLRSSAISFVLLNVMIGFMLPFVDMAAHLGGLAGGFLFALPLARPVGEAGRRGRTLRSAIVAALGAGAIWGALQMAPHEDDPMLEIERAVRGARGAGRLDEGGGSR
jgi:rhomboid protease GluP